MSLALSLMALVLLLAGCAPKARYAAGEALLRGKAPAAVAEPESLRAKLELTAFERGRKSSASAAFSAKPRSRYKLDVYGLPGMVEASFLWADTGWALVLHGREGYLLGYGDTVALPGLGIGAAPVHDLFGFLWGDFFPGGGEGDAAGRVVPAEWATVDKGRVRYRAGGHDWIVDLDPATGVVREAARSDSAFRVVHEKYRVRAGRPVPGRTRVFAGERPLLEIVVEDLEDRPAWSRDPFRLKIPKGFSPLR